MADEISAHAVVTEEFGDDESMEIESGNTGVSDSEFEEDEPVLIKSSPAILPKDTVHCYPAKRSVIMIRRVITCILACSFLAAALYFLLPGSFSIGLMGFAAAGAVICILVFIQTFLIASYRVALDYVKSEVVLRYHFQNIRISFHDFDTREGEPDLTEKQLSRIFLRPSKAAVKYLILDDVRASACYQTTSKDLASLEDFFQLKAEVENIRDVYRGKPDFPAEPVFEEDEMTRIINSARTDQPKNIDE